jgi:hypothetical protein
MDGCLPSDRTCSLFVRYRGPNATLDRHPVYCDRERKTGKREVSRGPVCRQSTRKSCSSGFLLLIGPFPRA